MVSRIAFAITISHPFSCLSFSCCNYTFSIHYILCIQELHYLQQQQPLKDIMHMDEGVVCPAVVCVCVLGGGGVRRGCRIGCTVTEVLWLPILGNPSIIPTLVNMNRKHGLWAILARSWPTLLGYNWLIQTTLVAFEDRWQIFFPFREGYITSCSACSSLSTRNSHLNIFDHL